VKRLAVIAARGTLNSLAQVATLVMAAAASEMAVRVFFRDEALWALTRGRVGGPRLSTVYRGHEREIMAGLAAQGLDDLPRVFTELREAGDVRLYACSSSMAICGIPAEELPAGLEVRGLTAFLLEDAAAADRLLTF
jgi:peroxiredoxin family protein